MSHVIFLRAANVGGHNKFQPKKLAHDLSEFDVVNVGAAGTFVVRATLGVGQLAREVRKRLPLEVEMMICPAGEISALARLNDDPGGKEDAQRYVTIMERAPRQVLRLPIRTPDDSKWQIKIVAVKGRYVLSLRRPDGNRPLYPNAVVEKVFGLAATTRNWTTIVKICEILRT